MEKDLIIEDILEKADKYSDTSLLRLLKRVENPTLAADQKLDMLEAEETAARVWSSDTRGELERILKQEQALKRIIVLLQKNSPKDYITYYPTEQNQLFKECVENTIKENKRRELRGDKPLPIPTQESEKVIHAADYWTESEAERKGYTTKTETQKKAALQIELSEIQQSILCKAKDLGLLTDSLLPSPILKSINLKALVAKELGKKMKIRYYASFFSDLWNGSEIKLTAKQLIRANSKIETGKGCRRGDEVIIPLLEQL